MRVEDIEQHEARFDAGGIDSQGIRHSMIRKAIEVPDDDHLMEYVDAGLANGDESYFYKTRYEKDQIVLHFTMGYLGGRLIIQKKQNNHVYVPFVIGRNGTIYNLYPSFYWSYHLGPGAVGGNEKRSKRTIGIEISNIGPLKPQGSELFNYYDDPYCHTNQTEFYHQQTFGGYGYFASFTNAQYDALITLLRYLTGRYGIPRDFLDENRRYETNSFVTTFRGIVSHVNYRFTGKTDIGPAFNWQDVISGVG